MTLEVCHIGLGSNLDGPAGHVTGALEELDALPRTRLLRQSGLFRSSPMGPADQPEYINAVAEIETGLAPLELLDELQAIEARHGRRRAGERRWGERPLDLDLLLIGDRVIDEPGLQVPHPGLHLRNFVLYPLAELVPDRQVPGRGAVAELAHRLGREGLSRLATSGTRE